MSRMVGPSAVTAAAPARRGLATAVGAPLVWLGLLLAGCGDGVDAPADARPIGTEIGHRAPPLTGIDAERRDFELRPAGDATLVVFFRGFRCGLCRERLRELQANLREYERAGARLVAVTADDADGVRRTVEELGLGYRVVSVDSATLGSWGVAPAERGLPLPGSYLLDRDGVVIYRHVGRNAAERAHDLELLAALRHVRGR